MTKTPDPKPTRVLALIAALLLLLAACGDDSEDANSEADSTSDAATGETAPDGSEDPAEGADPSTDDGEGSDPAETPAPEATEPEPAEPTEPVATEQTLEVAGGSNATWTAPGNCSWTPEAEGFAATVWVVETLEDDSTEEELTIFLAWPLSEDAEEPTLIGTVVEPDGNLLTVKNAEISEEGSTITVVAEVFNGLGGADDPADYTLTITCA